MTDVSVSECVSMVHPISDGSRPTENHAGPADHLGGVVVPPTTPAATNNKVESSSTISKPSRQQKPVSHGGPVRETQPGSTRPVIHRYSPLGVPKPHQTARVVRMVERAQREFAKAEQPYHSNMGAQQYPHRRLTSRSRWGTRTWNTWAAMEYHKHLPKKYLDKLNVDPQWWVTPQAYAPAPPPNKAE